MKKTRLTKIDTLLAPRSRFRAQGAAFAILGTFLLLMLVSSAVVSQAAEQSITENCLPGSDEYLLIGWNDLGMHCISPSYKEMAILPPFNNLWVQVIQRGDPPKIVTSGISLEYTLVNNSTVEGKTDFWQYAVQLYGQLFNIQSLPAGIGLTGNGLSGPMSPDVDHFVATGIPVLPYDDQMNWNPYQTAVVKLKDNSGRLLQTTRVIIPVSNELNCGKCHATGADASANYSIDTGTLEGNILTIHDIISKTNLMASQPVLCASCHASNALGAPGDGKRRSLSQAIHSKHSTLLTLGYMDLPGCYDCHPGAMTQCTRTGIGGMGYAGTEPSCPNCHGDLATVGGSIAQGRAPWLQEPTCEQCHGVNKTTGPALYRNSKGHGGVYCAACHNSPHAWWPSKLRPDNRQPMQTQGNPNSLGKCTACHLTRPAGSRNPHTTLITTPDIRAIPDLLDFGTVQVSQTMEKTLQITNRGTSDLAVQQMTITGPDAARFMLVDPAPLSLAPGKSCNRAVIFSPLAGTKTATLQISTNDPDTPVLTIPLEGTGQ